MPPGVPKRPPKAPLRPKLPTLAQLRPPARLDLLHLRAWTGSVGTARANRCPRMLTTRLHLQLLYLARLPRGRPLLRLQPRQAHRQLRMTRRRPPRRPCPELNASAPGKPRRMQCRRASTRQRMMQIFLPGMSWSRKPPHNLARGPMLHKCRMVHPSPGLTQIVQLGAPTAKRSGLQPRLPTPAV